MTMNVPMQETIWNL